LLLSSLRDALTHLAGSGFAAAFHGSTDQSTYRWGLLHRLTLAHPLGAPFSAPPAFGAFPAPLPGLTGVPVDGGFGTVDAASHNARADSADGFTFDSGPARRFVGSPSRAPWVPSAALPGGTSAVPGNRFYLNLLRPYLTNDYYPALLPQQVHRRSSASQLLVTP
jgi:penicillin amidase